MKISLFILILLFNISCYSLSHVQNDTQYDSITRRNVYSFVQEMPIYKNGTNDFLKDFAKAFHYNGTETQTLVKIQFVIDKKGRLTGARIYGKPKDDMVSPFEKAVLSAVSLLQNWTPGRHMKKNVNVIITQTIHIDYTNKQ
jgi:hypothetical protein